MNLNNATIYTKADIPQKAVILYFHGGGLVYGSREDLPDFHIETLTNAGFTIIAFDYPLAPESKIDIILSDIINSIESYIANNNLPYFLGGRSAGAYLCLLAASKKLSKAPNGILSYYGYGFLTRDWFETPSNYYNTLPKVSEKCLNICKNNFAQTAHLTADTAYMFMPDKQATGKTYSMKAEKNFSF